MSTAAAAAPTTTPSAINKKLAIAAVPFLGVLGGVQGAAPNISSTALVGASRGLDMVGATVALAASMQTMAIAASVITVGLLADRLGRRRVLMASLIAAAAGQLTVAAAPTPGVFLAGQILTGVGLGAVYGAAFAYIRAVAKPGKTAAAVSLFTAVVGLSMVLLVFAGGQLASINWRLSYVIIAAASIVCLLLTPLILPPEARLPGGKMDIIGQVLLAVGIVSFLYGISQLAHSLTSPQSLGPLILGVILMGAFAWYEARNENRFFPISLFKSPIFLAALCAGFVYNFGTPVAFLQVTNLWQYVNGLQTDEVSIWQLPLTCSGIVAAIIIGRLMGRGMTNATVLIIGVTSTTIGFVSLALLHTSKGLLGFLPGLILVGAGVIIASIPFGNLFLKEAPPQYFGPVTSSRTTFGQLIYSVGFAVSTVVLDKLTTGGIVTRLEAAGVPPTQTGTGLDGVTVYASNGTAPTTSAGKQALADAVVSYGNAFATMMIIAAVVVAIVGAVGAVLLIRSEQEHHHDTPTPAPTAS